MATYKADHVQFGRLMKSPDIREHLRGEAEKFAAHLAASAPRTALPKPAAHYADNFKVATGFDLLKRDRVAAFVYNDTRYATALEVGSWNIRNPPAVMTKALDAFHI